MIIIQIIDINDFDIRSAVYRIKRAEDELEFILFPMVHIGSKEYYDEISQRLNECDLIITEGVESKNASFLTWSYSIVDNIKRMGLTTQNKAMRYSEFESKTVNVDIDKKSFDTQWNKISWRFRLGLLFYIPVHVLNLLIFGNKKTVAKMVSDVEDLSSRQEIDWGEKSSDFNRLIMDDRDQILTKKIEEICSEERNSKYSVGILYGAKHMRSVIRFLLNKRKYNIVESKWVVVFEF